MFNSCQFEFQMQAVRRCVLHVTEVFHVFPQVVGVLLGHLKMHKATRLPPRLRAAPFVFKELDQVRLKILRVM